MKNNILQNSENYNNELDCTVHEIYNKFIGVVNEYIIHQLDIINNNKSKQLPIIRVRRILYIGIQCLTHIFKTILLYTKNISLTLYHTQRAFYFYVEFMEQILEESHSFLQLTPKDACLFVYKKTIYEIDTTYRTEYNIDTINDELCVDGIITFYTTLINVLIEENDNYIVIIKTMNNDVFKIIQTINKLYYKINDLEILNNKIQLMNDFIYINKPLRENYKHIEKYIKSLKYD